MADTLTLEVAPRSAKGKANKALRRSGSVPVHVFGHGIESQGLQAEEKALRHVVHQAGASGLIDIQVEGQPQKVMVRKVQRHPVNGKLIHVDFYQVRMDTKTRVRLALLFVGEAPGVKLHDGSLLHAVEAINVEALPGDLPHHLEVDISVLEELDQALHIRDLVIPDKLTVLDDPDEMVAKIQPPRKVEEEVVAPEAAAPEGAEGAEGAAEAEPAAEGSTKGD
ncbi:MAG TPA: 50S ribosomal protein L25 [Chloroflexota bacterium]|jgi:large subunit ribosomal protein L25